jgi:hypothetical protein
VGNDYSIKHCLKAFATFHNILCKLCYRIGMKKRTSPNVNRRLTLTLTRKEDAALSEAIDKSEMTLAQLVRMALRSAGHIPSKESQV